MKSVVLKDLWEKIKGRFSFFFFSSWEYIVACFTFESENWESVKEILEFVRKTKAWFCEERRWNVTNAEFIFFSIVAKEHAQRVKYLLQNEVFCIKERVCDEVGGKWGGEPLSRVSVQLNFN